MFVGVSDNPSDAGQGSDLIRRALSVTTGDQDSGIRVLAMNFSYSGASVMIRRCGYSTGVQDYNICMDRGFRGRHAF